MKKLFALLLVLCMVFTLVACSSDTPAKPDESKGDTPAGDVTITLWTYPIGGWGNSDTVKALTDKFEAANPGIKVSVEYLDYTNGDDQVNTAIEGKKAPDLIMEGPERLVANWGAKGYMVDLAGLWDDTDKKEINPSVTAACFNAEGKCFEYPVCMTAHCMAINLDAFKKAGADQYLDLENHTWTTDGFVNAVKALKAAGYENVAAIYCSGQGGDQGTRAIINNLYSGTFTNPEHTAYTADSEQNVKALELLKSLDGVKFDASINGGEEINLFRQGVLQMAFCWNIGAQNNVDAGNEAGKTNNGEEIVCMAFPTDDGKAELCGGIWGFGIFDNGDAAKIEAAKKFVKFMGDGEGTAEAVKASTYFAVRDTAEGNDLTKIYADNPVMTEYTKLMPMLGDYYQVVPGWAEARTAWWNMLQQIGSGTDVAAAVAEFVKTANAAAGA